MNGSRPSSLTPALIGGAAAGVLSGLPVFQCLCCLWIIGGAVLAVSLWYRETAAPVTPGDGARVGALAGVFAAVLSAAVSLPFTRVQLAFIKKFFQRLQEYIPAASRPESLDRLLNMEVRGFSVEAFLFNLAVLALLFAALGALGGVIGASVFGKKPAPPADPAVPPPGSRT
jgi:hypothetical protein